VRKTVVRGGRLRQKVGGELPLRFCIAHRIDASLHESLFGADSCLPTDSEVLSLIGNIATGQQDDNHRFTAQFTVRF
jgi:hypothetical protein